VGHAFHNDTGAAWNEQAGVDAWKTMMAWFKKYLA
jgi:dienelactone hydrolase